MFMKTPNAPKILKEVLSIAPDAWLFGATLLGAIREGKIISWDKDIDLGYPSHLVTPELIERFRAAGYTVSGEYKFSHPEMPKFIPDHMGEQGKFILGKDGVKVEMCCFAPGKDGLLYYASGTPRFFVLPESLVYPQKKIALYDFEALVPENAEGQLSFVYGENWRTPIEKWYFTPAHYLRREHTIIELGPDDGTKWSKTTGRRVIADSRKTSRENATKIMVDLAKGQPMTRCAIVYRGQWYDIRGLDDHQLQGLIGYILGREITPDMVKNICLSAVATE